MRHDHRILYGDSSYTLRFEMPQVWTSVTGVDITITDDGGTALQAATAATITAASTISADATKGRRTITVTGGTWEPGDLLRIADSDDGPAEDVRVRSWDAATKIATLNRRLKTSHASGAALSARWCTYALDASGTSWSNLEEGSILWDPDGDNQAATSTFVVSTKTAQPQGVLEDRFRIAYAEDYDDIPQGGFGLLRDYAIDDLTDLYAPRGLRFQDVVSQSATERIILAQIAYNAAVSAGKTDRVEVLETVLSSQRAAFESLRHWADDDQDSIEEDDEIGAATMPLPQRRW